MGEITMSELREMAPGEHAVICGCGGIEGKHYAGDPECLRFVVSDPKEIPRNRRYHYNPPGGWHEPVWVWDVGDSMITEYTLFNQRMYSYDEKTKQWTRPKSRDSVNSIKG